MTFDKFFQALLTFMFGMVSLFLANLTSTVKELSDQLAKNNAWTEVFRVQIGRLEADQKELKQRCERRRE